MAALTMSMPNMLDIAPRPESPSMLAKSLESDKSADKPYVSRRPHTKSRAGCNSCKRRRQKCDEQKPACSRCVRLQFDCEYLTSSTKLLSTDSAQTPDTSSPASTYSNTSLTQMSVSSTASVTAAIQDVLGVCNARATPWVADDLNHFVYSEFTNSFGTYQDQITFRVASIQLGMTRPFLMHTVLALASMQKRLAQTTYTPPSANETRHWQRGTQLFRSRLASQPTKGDNTALLATAAYMNGLTFASMTTMDPNEAWPIKNPVDSLMWVRMLRGPALMLGALRAEQNEEEFMASPAGLASSLINHADARRPGIEGIPKAWVDLCGFTPTTTVKSNPYHATVRAICLWAPHISPYKAGVYFSFIGSVTDDFVDLLEQKDHRALLILSYWYSALLTSDMWWCRCRPKVECQAICMYLEKFGGLEIKRLLEYPAAACGHHLRSPKSLDDDILAMTIPDNCALM